MTMTLSNDIWIEQVEAVHFQSLKHVIVHFVKGTNALVGTSNSGKTSIIRAIRWCLLNKPNGDYFITTGTKEAMVKVRLSNGKTIERRKGAGVNLYRVYEGDDLSGEYTGFGTSVPEEVIEAHGIRPISGDIYFQFSMQLESAFLLSLRPSKRADVLGNMDELKRIDQGLLSINSDIREKSKAKKERTAQSKQLGKDQKRLASETARLSKKIEALRALKDGVETKINLLSFVEEQVKRLRDIEVVLQEVEGELQKSHRILKAWPDDLAERVSLYREITQQTNRLRDIDQEMVDLQFMKKEKLDELEQLRQTIEAKISVYQEVNQAVKELKQNEERQKKAANSYSAQIAALDIEPLEKEIAKYQLLYRHIDRLREIDTSLAETDQMIAEAKGRIETTLFEFADALQEAKFCPTCGQDTHDVCAETIESIL